MNDNIVEKNTTISEKIVSNIKTISKEIQEEIQENGITNDAKNYMISELEEMIKTLENK